MTISAVSGPMIAYGQSPYAASEYNPELGPSMFYAGAGILDPRAPFTYKAGQDFGQPVCGFFGFTEIITLNVVPAAAATGAIAAAQNVTSGTAMTLPSTTANGVTVASSVTNFNTGLNVTGLLAIGGPTGRVKFGSSGTIQLWDSTTMLSRVLSITGVASGTGGAFKIAGYDVYGVPMTETITVGAGVNTVSGLKAWKYVASVTPQFTDAHTYSVNTTDVIGFPLASYYFGDLFINYPSLGITASTGYLPAVTTSPATSTTGDVRGTYALQSASNGTNRIIITQTPLIANIGSITGLFGVTQA